MKTLSLAVMVGVASAALAGNVSIQKTQGDVHVRHGVTEEWLAVAPGDALRPDDSMWTGKHGSAVLLLREETPGGPTVKRITLPSEVIIDIADIRTLTQEELMLKLTMEKVRASSYRWKEDELQIPDAAVIHGEDKADAGSAGENDVSTGLMQLKGTRVLFENGFFSTCALKAMEVFRLYPSLKDDFASRLMVADALAKAELKGEALAEYGTFLQSGNITVEQRSLLEARMQRVRE
jgi:hypothetical protein